MRKLSLYRWAAHRYKMILGVIAIGGIAGLLVFFQLGSLLPGTNHYELAAIDRLANLSYPTSDPLNYPYFIVAKFLDFVFSPLISLRLTSAILGLGTLILLSFTLRQWFNNRIAVAGTLLIATTSWFLHISRIGDPGILSTFWLSMFFAVGTWRTYTTRPFVADCLIAISSALSLYSPYFAWLGAIGFIVLALRRRRQLFVLPRRHQWFLPIIVAGLITPLVLACIKDQSIIKNLLGIAALPSNGYAYLLQIAQNISQVFFRGFSEPALNLGRLPLLDVFSVVMTAMGLYYFERRLLLRRSQIIFGIGSVLLLSVSLSEFDLSKLAIFFPLFMLLIVGGIVEILDRWLNGFPRNPIARSVGVGVLVIAIGFTSFYHLQRYFVAWANNPDVVAEHKR